MWRHITVSTVLIQEEIPEAGGKKISFLIMRSKTYSSSLVQSRKGQTAIDWSSCCIFWPANGSSVPSSLVKIYFFYSNCTFFTSFWQEKGGNMTWIKINMLFLKNISKYFFCNFYSVLNQMSVVNQCLRVAFLHIFIFSSFLIFFFSKPGKIVAKTAKYATSNMCIPKVRKPK